MPNIPNIRKKEQFETFLKIIAKGAVSHWVDIAKILGVDKDTITEWKKHPLAKQVIAEGISHALREMEKAGRGDWRMWREKLSMLGLREEKNKQNLEVPEKDVRIVFDPSLKNT